MNNKVFLIFLAIFSNVTFSQGFRSATSDGPNGNKLNKFVGKTFTLMPNPAANPLLKCGKHLGYEFIDKPTIRTANIYESPAPIQYSVESIAESLDPYSSGAKYLKITINDDSKTTAYFRDFKFSTTKLDGKVATALRGCNFEGNLEVVINEIEKAKNAKQISIGMNANNVEYETEWGTPDKINTLQTANILQTQWVYDKFWKKGFLYFDNEGILTAIQE